MRSVRSRGGAGEAGRSSPAGGWKWMPLGASSSIGPSNALGGSPCARAKARENAAAEP